MNDGLEPDGSVARRSFLRGAGALAMVGVGAAACSSEAADGSPEQDDSPDSSTADATPEGSPAVETHDSSVVPFRSDRQLGVSRPVTAAGASVAFDVLVDERDALAELLQDLSAEIERMMAAQPAEDVSEVQPPLDSGLLGPTPTPTGLAVALGVGASLFDDRFGLGELRPRELTPMPRFRNDRFVEAARSDGDLCFTISADSPQAVTHAVQQLVRVTERKLQLRWLQEGYNDLTPAPSGAAPARNLLGFKDGTSNLDVRDDTVLTEHVWVDAAAGEPAWAAGGTYQAVRNIRMLIEFWSTVALVRQELIIGRDKETGAPLGQLHEADEPAFASDQDNVDVPPASHMRRANPRTGEAPILRRGFSWVNGADSAGLLDQGLLFLAYQRSLQDGFIATQARLDGEPLEDYIKPVGGGFFFVLPGPGTGADGWLGESLLTS